MKTITDEIFNYLKDIQALNRRENRDILLRNLPKEPVAALLRPDAMLSDINGIISAAETWGLIPALGRPALAIVLENSRPFVSGTGLETRLDDLLAKITPQPRPQSQATSASVSSGPSGPAVNAQSDGIGVFISYAREDLNLAKRLYADLKASGIRPWLDDYDLLPGQNWKVAIRKAIKESRFVIALISTRSASKRGYVHKEMKMALDILDEFPEGEIFLIPARLDHCAPPDYRLEDINYVDLFPDYQGGLNKILRAINTNRKSQMTNSK